MKLDVAERLSRAIQRDLVLGGAVGVVECGARGAPLGDATQILDRQRFLEALRGTVQPWPAEPDQRREVTDPWHPPLHRRHCLLLCCWLPRLGVIGSRAAPYRPQRSVGAQAARAAAA